MIFSGNNQNENEYSKFKEFSIVTENTVYAGKVTMYHMIYNSGKMVKNIRSIDEKRFNWMDDPTSRWNTLHAYSRKLYLLLKWSILKDKQRWNSY